MVVVISACKTGAAIDGTDENPEYNIRALDRIIITNTDKNETGWSWAGDSWTESDNYDHSEFLYNEGDNGFLFKLSDNEYISMQTAFDSGYDAAQDNDWEITGDDTSTPQLYHGVGYAAEVTYL